MAYDLLEPFGSPAEDARAGTIAAILANVHSAKGAAPKSAKDFFPNAQTRSKQIFPEMAGASKSGLSRDEAEDIQRIKAMLK